MVDTSKTDQSVFLLFVLAILLSILSGCATTDQVRVVTEPAYRESMSHTAYKKAEKLLKRIEIGKTLTDNKLDWNIYTLENTRGELRHVYCTGDGWIGPMSGYCKGSMSQVGNIIGLNDSYIYGEHVYGYVIEHDILLPQYVIRTRAKLVGEERADNIGIYSQDVPWGTLHYETAVVDEVVTVSAEFQEMTAGGTMSLLSFTEAYYTKKNYNKTEGMVRQFQAGQTSFEAILGLGAHFSLLDGFSDFMIFIPGFLNLDGDYRTTVVKRSGVYVVWPFGWVEQGKEIPKLALVEKNGKVHKIMEYTSKEEVLSTLE